MAGPCEHDDAIADALAFAFTDEHHKDGVDNENIIDAVNHLARAVRDLGNGNAATHMGGMEALGKAMLDSAELIASAIGRLADAIEGTRP